jgi:hypothetical protein
MPAEKAWQKQWQTSEDAGASVHFLVDAATTRIHCGDESHAIIVLAS